MHVTWLYTVIDGANVRVPYDLRTGAIDWPHMEQWTETPSKVNDAANPDGFHKSRECCKKAQKKA